MEQAKHTPGPWRIEDGAVRSIVADADKHLGSICDMRSRLDYPGMHPIVAETRDANARLIASAPELLEALQKFLSAQTLLPELSGPAAVEMIGAAQAARRAIAKATGGAL